jgi:hypothetical protein
MTEQPEDPPEETTSGETTSKKKRHLNEAQHIQRISRALNKENTGAIEVGEALKDAHDQLFGIIPEKGTRTHAWAKWLEYNFGLTRGTASKYMSIAARGALFRKYLAPADVSPGKHETYLPSGMTALYELSTIQDDDLLEALIHSGETAGLTKEKAHALALEVKGEEPAGRKKSREAEEAWALECENRFQAAEAATNGYLIIDEAKNDGVNPRSLFRKPDKIIRLHATEELRDWLDANPGTPKPDFIRQYKRTDEPETRKWEWSCMGCWLEFSADCEDDPVLTGGDVPANICLACLKVLQDALRSADSGRQIEDPAGTVKGTEKAA